MKKKKTRKKDPEGEKAQPKKAASEEESRKGYGGLPERDLKKNLGC